MEQVGFRTFSVSHPAGSSGQNTNFAVFYLPEGVYLFKCYAQGGGTDVSISEDQASIFYQTYDSTKQPTVIALLQLSGTVPVTWDCAAVTNNASTTTGFIEVYKVEQE